MRSIACIVVLTCVMVAGGCSSDEATAVTEGQSQVSVSSPSYVVESAQREGCPLLTVEEFSLTAESLKLKYRVTNTLLHDIWICTVQRFFTAEDSPPKTEVRVIDPTLRIMRRANLEQNCWINGHMYAGYHRYAPGQAWSGTIVLPVPVRHASGVYQPIEGPSHVVLNRVVLELGYFDGDLRSLVQEQSLQYTQKGWRALVFGLTQSQENPNLMVVPYLDPDKWDGLAHEKTVEVVISGVRVPGVSGKEPLAVGNPHIGGTRDSHLLWRAEIGSCP